MDEFVYYHKVYQNVVLLKVGNILVLYVANLNNKFYKQILSFVQRKNANATLQDIKDIATLFRIVYDLLGNDDTQIGNGWFRVNFFSNTCTILDLYISHSCFLVLEI